MEDEVRKIIDLIDTNNKDLAIVLSESLGLCKVVMDAILKEYEEKPCPSSRILVENRLRPFLEFRLLVPYLSSERIKTIPLTLERLSKVGLNLNYKIIRSNSNMYFMDFGWIKLVVLGYRNKFQCQKYI